MWGKIIANKVLFDAIEIHDLDEATEKKLLDVTALSEAKHQSH